ncbi:unnamed protein product [Amoebophrya sp. A25]|nr:unnamed protein product [Amoebophrya sp. A25]|eukprot:GSA25T00004633001.1
MICTARGLHPVGFSTDGVPIGGREIEQSSVRGPFLSDDIMVTITLPPLITRRDSYANVEQMIRATTSLQVSEEDRTNIRAAASQSCLLYRVSSLIDIQVLGVGKKVFVCIDRGSKQRTLYLWRLCRGDPIHIRFDPPHAQSNDLLKVSRLILPPDVVRTLRIRGTAGGAHSCKIGTTCNIFANDCTFQQCMDFMGILCDSVAEELGVSTEDDQFVPALKARAKDMAAELSTFSGTKRWAKFDYAANWLVKNWTLLQAIVNYERLKLEGCSVTEFEGGRVVSHVREEGGVIVLDVSDEDLRVARQILDEERQHQVHEDRLKDEGFGNESSDEEAAAAVDAGGNWQADEGIVLPAHEEAAFPVAGARPRVHQNEERTAAEKKREQQARQRRDKKDEDKALFAVLYRLLNCPYSKARVFIYEKYGRPALYFHAIGVAISWQHFLSHKIYYSEHPSLLSELAGTFNSEIPATILRMQQDIPVGWISEVIGLMGIEVLRT